MNYDSIAEAYLTSNIDIHSIPCADISHHHKPELNESVNSWVNQDRPVDNRYTTEHISRLRTIVPYWSEKDPYEPLSRAHDAALTDQSHARAIHAYINGSLGDEDFSTGSEMVNRHLLEAHQYKVEPRRLFSFPQSGLHLNLDHLDAALRTNRLNGPLVTYSGLGFNPGRLLSDSGLLHLPAYTSSSTNKIVALRYTTPDSQGLHILRIHHTRGSTGFYVGDNQDYSDFAQKEHIMPRGVTIKVNPVPDIHQDPTGTKLHVWNARRLLSLEKNK